MSYHSFNDPSRWSPPFHEWPPTVAGTFRGYTSRLGIFTSGPFYLSIAGAFIARELRLSLVDTAIRAIHNLWQWITRRLPFREPQLILMGHCGLPLLNLTHVL
jgi:hypothetical protein